MGYHPETLAFSFPPYARNRKGFGRWLYALKPWIGFDIWHHDAENRTDGQRTDDSCGWFDRRPGEYADAEKYMLADQCAMHDINLILARKVETLAPFYEGISARHYSYPRLPAADCLAVCLLVARELEHLRWWSGAGGSGGACASWLRRKFTSKRNVDQIAFDLALNPTDNLSTADDPARLIRLVAGALHRKFKPWWKHPRWHVHHWQVNFDIARNLKRMVQPCGTCGKRLGFGYCPTRSGDGALHHGNCVGIYAASRPDAA